MDEMSAVIVDLDTHPPVIEITAPARVTPPEVIEVTVAASEEIGHGSFMLVDAYGGRHALGFERISPTTLVVVIPTVGMTWGQAVLTGWVDDLVCNRTPISRAVDLRRPAGVTTPFTVDLSFEQAMDVELTTDEVFEVVLSSEPAGFEVELTTDGIE